MAVDVKRASRISSKHQVTIPVGALRDAGLRAGDAVQVEVQGPGRVVLTALDDLLDRYSGCLESESGLRETVEGLREEWR